ncbi:MAG: tRNA pseudouridine(55) synthase TruB [Gemmatimonadetes bacterium]|nr:tRNA pseudouridine(55) synthase TruB [Gemmatimonadota bacterium]
MLVNKPRGFTSHDVVEIVRRRLGVRRVGHTGTLDPMAEGLLILLVGAATKHQHAFQSHEKTYEAALRLGTQTDTGDAMGTVIRTAAVPSFDRRRAMDVLAAFRGACQQTPPAYSAVKVHGRPAYWWARRQRPVTLSARTVQFFETVLLDCGADVVRFRVRCSAGTYVRSLAENIAERLGTVGHLEQLVRLRIDQWDLARAKPLAWIQQASVDEVAGALSPIPMAHRQRQPPPAPARRSSGGAAG